MIEVTYVRSRTVSCAGGSNSEGHPKIFLEIKQDQDSVICPYCSKKFVMED